ncbi:Endo-1,4-beta-xylanase A [Cucumis melo var. makuwa]|uniref:Endo-1,4-beta-xylanase A n=1 Tax=Cucumis melo var. makuwa TaxID=1194695 RepID=A0A5D3CAF3_CUCMM|nr:Endo-1,4-beta-xylanase A [Cucumis melo var. makuwa]TYK08262.1 Endo-1,4-beta-xylanase A [Cucumis melo var. makuwa]
MSSANPSGKAQKDRLVELEEQMLYLVKVPHSIRYLESRLNEISEKTDIIDAVAGRVEGLQLQELLARVDTLEENVGRTVNYEYGDSSSGFVAHMEGRVNVLDSSQKTLLEMINSMLEDFQATLDVVRSEIADVNTRLSLTMRAMANQAPIGGAVPVTKYFKATNTVTEEAKVTLATMYLCEDAKLWWRNSSQSSPKAVRGDKRSGKDRRSYQSTTENTWRRPNDRSPTKRPLSCFICWKPHLARECLNKVDFHAFQASLIADSDDKSNQAEDEMGQIDRSEKTRIGAIKYMSSLQKKSGERHTPTKGGLLFVDTWINQKQTKSTMVDSGATHNFITEAEARRLKLRWENDSGRMKVVNSIALPIVGLVKRTTIKLGG